MVCLSFIARDTWVSKKTRVVCEADPGDLCSTYSRSVIRLLGDTSLPYHLAGGGEVGFIEFH
jgi:hypothetical protein